MMGFSAAGAASFNNRFQPTVKSVIFFAEAKKLPLFTSAEAGVRFSKKN
jgi:hypothetical protein